MSPPIIFPYKVYKGIACPIIGLEVRGPKGRLRTEAFVDSGASISVFLIKEAGELGIDFQKGKVVYSTVGDGSCIPVYLHKLLIKIGNIPFKATVGFSPKLGIGFNLLGRKDIFEHFDVTFSDSARTISFAPL